VSIFLQHFTISERVISSFSVLTVCICCFFVEMNLRTKVLSKCWWNWLQFSLEFNPFSQMFCLGCHVPQFVYGDKLSVFARLRLNLLQFLWKFFLWTNSYFPSFFGNRMCISGKAFNIEYGNIDFEKVIIEILTSTQI